LEAAVKAGGVPAAEAVPVVMARVVGLEAVPYVAELPEPMLVEPNG
jgi:hypothetical protein